MIRAKHANPNAMGHTFFCLRCPYCDYFETVPSDWTDEELLQRHQDHAASHGATWEQFLEDLQGGAS